MMRPTCSGPLVMDNASAIKADVLKILDMMYLLEPDKYHIKIDSVSSLNIMELLAALEDSLSVEIDLISFNINCHLISVDSLSEFLSANSIYS